MIKTNLHSPLPFLLLLVVLFSSCEKEERAIAAHEKGEVTTTVVDLETDYRYQVFYDLETNTEVSRNLKTAWDLGFETGAEGSHIVLNSSKFMQVYHTESNDFSNTLSIPTAGWLHDEPSGNLDSTAMGGCVHPSVEQRAGFDEVYIIDLGYNNLGTHLGYKKLLVEGFDAQGYTIRYANLNGTDEHRLTLEKNDLYNFTFFSFYNGGQTVMIQPPKEDWDLAFTQYTHIFHDGSLPAEYLVTGILQNTNNTLVIGDNTVGFSNYSFDQVNPSSLLPDANTIGYLWKEYDRDAGIYSIFSEKNYIIQSEQGFYYKLHFIDFYDASGQKGSPTFEYQRL